MGATRSRWKTNGAQRITHSLRGYWHQRADDRFGDPPPKVIQEPLVVRDRDGNPKRTLWQCTASVCVAGVQCWEISLGITDPGNVIFCLSDLLIYPRIFLHVFIAYLLLVGFRV